MCLFLPEPFPPKKLVIHSIRRTSAVASWKHPRCYEHIAPVAVFKLLLTEWTGIGKQFPAITTGFKLSYRFSSLKPCTTYSVRVAAKNKRGTSTLTPPEFFTTKGSKCKKY